MLESEVARSCLTLCDPMDCSPLAPPSMGFARQRYWSGLPFPEGSSYLSLTEETCVSGHQRFLTAVTLKA